MSPPPSTTPAKPSRHRLFIGIMLAIVVLGGVVSFLMSGGKSHRRAPARQDIVTITLPPPPPVTPPPPPPPQNEPPPPKDEEMVEQDPVPDNEPPPEAAQEAPPSEDLSTGIAGNGPDMGLSRGGNGGNGKIGGTGKRGGGSRFGWYAAKVQTSIADALRRNSSTRNAILNLQVRVWADSNGRITRAQLVGTSGNPAVDGAIKNQILTGLQLPQAPPADMPMPITMRVTARKPAI